MSAGRLRRGLHDPAGLKWLPVCERVLSGCVSASDQSLQSSLRMKRKRTPEAGLGEPTITPRAPPLSSSSHSSSGSQPSLELEVHGGKETLTKLCAGDPAKFEGWACPGLSEERSPGQDTDGPAPGAEPLSPPHTHTLFLVLFVLAWK